MKSDLIQTLTADPDERIALARVLDCAEAAAQRSVPAHTGFLTPHLRALAAQLAPGAAFCGGYPEAERVTAVFLPDWADPEDAESYAGLSVIRAARRDRGEPAPTHRDYLGALLGLGLRREALGDLLVRPEGCDMIVSEGIAAFIRDNLTSAGHSPLELTIIDPQDLIVPEQAFTERRDTVASLRLDGVAAAAFSLSRGRAAEAVAAGKVSVNGVPCEKADREVADGDTVSLRGAGKCRVRTDGALSRKGRICIVIQKYL